MDYNNNENSNSENNEEFNSSNQNLNEESKDNYNSTFNSDYNYNDSFNNDYNSNFNNNFNSNFNDPNYNRRSTVNGLAIASLILGILSIPLSCCYGIGGIISAIAGIILAIISRKDSDDRISGMAIASIVISIIGFIFGVIMLIGFILVLSDPEFTDLIQSTQNGFY